MQDETAVYDLGEVQRAAPAAREKTQIRIASGAPASNRAAGATTRPIDAMTDSLELFLPGTGQMLRGRWSDGFAVFAGAGFLTAMAWAIWETLDRLAATMVALGYTPAFGVYALAMLYVCLAALHAGNVLYGTSRGPERAHPAAAGIASALIPGWGQLINRQPAKAATFVAGLWAAGMIWLLASPWTTELFDTYGLAFRPGFDKLGAPAVLYTVPIVIWALSIYDAISTSRR